MYLNAWLYDFCALQARSYDDARTRTYTRVYLQNNKTNDVSQVRKYYFITLYKCAYKPQQFESN